tara:strand:- start:9907 stop:10932 length:1026 start_codon:yes stop_codon:yes gene_type:complete
MIKLRNYKKTNEVNLIKNNEIIQSGNDIFIKKEDALPIQNEKDKHIIKRGVISNFIYLGWDSLLSLTLNIVKGFKNENKNNSLNITLLQPNDKTILEYDYFIYEEEKQIDNVSEEEYINHLKILIRIIDHLFHAFKQNILNPEIYSIVDLKYFQDIKEFVDDKIKDFYLLKFRPLNETNLEIFLKTKTIIFLLDKYKYMVYSKNHSNSITRHFDLPENELTKFLMIKSNYYDFFESDGEIIYNLIDIYLYNVFNWKYNFTGLLNKEEFVLKDTIIQDSVKTNLNIVNNIITGAKSEKKENIDLDNLVKLVKFREKLQSFKDKIDPLNKLKTKYKKSPSPNK